MGAQRVDDSVGVGVPVWSLSIAGRPVIVGSRNAGRSWASTAADEFVWQELAAALQGNAVELEATFYHGGRAALAESIGRHLDDLEALWAEAPDLLRQRVQMPGPVAEAVMDLRQRLARAGGIQATRLNWRPPAVDRLCEDDAEVRLAHPAREVSGLVSRDPAIASAWRLTVFDQEGPVGHIGYRSKRAALLDAMREGFEEAPDATAPVPEQQAPHGPGR